MIQAGASAMARALRSADPVIALTQHEANRLVEAYGVNPDCVSVAKAESIVARPGPPVPARPNRVLFLGRRARSKNIGELIRAMQEVWPTHPDVELWIAGARASNPDHIDRQIAALPTHFRRQVTNLGVITEEEKSALLQSARCLVLPSKIELFGIVLLEAWAHATPVITWDLPVFRSFIRNRVSGLLADPDGGSQSLANAILEMLQNEAKADAMAQEGFKLANSDYSWESVADIYLAAYQHALSRNVRHSVRIMRDSN